MSKGFCFKCKEKRTIEHGHLTTTKNGRKILKGKDSKGHNVTCFEKTSTKTKHHHHKKHKKHHKKHHHHKKSKK